MAIEFRDNSCDGERFVLIRVFGDRFFQFANRTSFRLPKPNDNKLHRAMVIAARRLLEETKAAYVHVENGQMLIYCQEEALSKIRASRDEVVSMVAGLTAFSLSKFFSREVVFDVEITAIGAFSVPLTVKARQIEAENDMIDAYCYWIKDEQGISARNAAKWVENVDLEEKLELLKEEFAENPEIPSLEGLPGWQKNGTGVYHMPCPLSERVESEPSKDSVVVESTDFVIVDEELPTGAGMVEYMRILLLPREDREAMVEETGFRMGQTAKDLALAYGVR